MNKNQHQIFIEQKPFGHLLLHLLSRYNYGQGVLAVLEIILLGDGVLYNRKKGIIKQQKEEKILNYQTMNKLFNKFLFRIDKMFRVQTESIVQQEE